MVKPILIGILIAAVTIAGIYFDSNSVDAEALEEMRRDREYKEAYSEGYEDGYKKGYYEGQDAGYREGYGIGYEDCEFDMK